MYNIVVFIAIIHNSINKVTLMPSIINLVRWFNSNKNSTNNLSLGDVFEYRFGYPTTQILFDRSKPVGEAVINLSDEMKVHTFELLNNSGNALTVGRYVTQDILDNYLATIPVSSFGGSANETSYVQVGGKNVHSLTALFDANTTVKAIRIAATAITAKQYRIEVKLANSDLWKPVLNTIASAQSRDYFVYTFSNAVSLDGVRIKYKGSYYARTNDNNMLTVAARDKLCKVTDMRISHFADFSDARDVGIALGSSDLEGWVPLTQPLAKVSIALSNNERLWNAHPVKSDVNIDGLNKIFKLNNNIVALGDTSAYVISYTTSYSAMSQSSYVFPGAITAAVVDSGILYVGLSNGSVFTTRDGNSYSQLLAVQDAQPITALAVYQNTLYIGTDQSRMEGRIGKLYAWDSASGVRLISTFIAPIVSTLVSAKGILFIGTASGSGVKLGCVYKYTGAGVPEITFDSGKDAITSMAYSPVNDKLWIGISDGLVYMASFVNNLPVWSSNAAYSNDSSLFYSISSDPTSNLPINVGDPVINHYVWLCSDTQLVAYVSSSSKIAVGQSSTIVTTNSYESVVWPVSPTSTTIKSMVHFNNDVFGASIDGNVYKLDLETIGSKQRNIYVQFRDEAGNTSLIPPSNDYDYIFDTVFLGAETIGATGERVVDGHIYQVTADASKEIVKSYYPTGADKSAILAADRKVRVSGYYVSHPFYVAELTGWDKIAITCNMPDVQQGSDPGLDYGVSIDIYCRASDTKTGLETKDWGIPYSISNINGEEIPDLEFDISNKQGKWLQFYVVLTTASRNVYPELLSTEVHYKSSGASFFFSSVFDTTAILSKHYNLVRNWDFDSGVDDWLGSDLDIANTADGKARISHSSGIPGTVSTIFSVDKHFFGKDFIVSFDYVSSPGYSEGDLTVRLFNDSNLENCLDAINIPANHEGDTFMASGTFSEAIANEENHTYILCIETASAGEFTCDIDNVYIGPDYSSRMQLLQQNPPKIRRGILTANTSISDGSVEFAYTTDDSILAFNYNSGVYTKIVPNKEFELSIPSSKIRFAIMFVKVGDAPVVVHDFAALLESHDIDIKYMDLPDL